jgi:hypothetical protein
VPAQPIPAPQVPAQQLPAAPPAAWQQGVPGVPTPAAYPSLPTVTPNHVQPPAQVMPMAAPASAPTNVIPESIAAAMRNAGISVDGYTIVPG